MHNNRSIFSERCWFQNRLQPATVVISAGKIIDVLLFKTDDSDDVGNDILMPGIIDAHVHINEPGRTDWEGFETATKAAAAGGITTVIDMPLNASPVTTNVEALKLKLHSTENKLFVNVGFYGGLIPGNIENIEALILAGVSGIKCFLSPSGIDEFPNVGEAEISEAMPIIAKYGVPLLAHCELLLEEADCALSAYPSSYKEYLASRPLKWENDAVQLMIDLCRKYHCPVHIVHVSSAEALSIIQAAKEEGLPVTAETCAHYIYFSAELITDKNTLFKCAPPIREAANNLLLKKALKNGVLDFLTTDHSPAPPEIKKIESGNFETGWGGIAGLQFLLPASWSALKNILDVEEFIPLLTKNPAKFLKLDRRKGSISIGFDADLTIWDPSGMELIKEDAILHRHKMSPYAGQKLYGTVSETIVGGVSVYKNRNIVDEEIRNGKIILNKPVSQL